MVISISNVFLGSQSMFQFTKSFTVYKVSELLQSFDTHFFSFILTSLKSVFFFFFLTIHLASQPAPTMSKTLGWNFLKKYLWLAREG